MKEVEAFQVGSHVSAPQHLGSACYTPQAALDSGDSTMHEKHKLPDPLRLTF